MTAGDIPAWCHDTGPGFSACRRLPRSAAIFLFLQQQASAEHEQTGPCRSHLQPMHISRRTPVSNFDESEESLENADRVLDLSWARQLGQIAGARGLVDPPAGKSGLAV
jgi:hypothetical protein